MELYEDRLLKGILSAGHAADPNEAQALLAKNFNVIAPPGRATIGDLWPLLWALCACLERQFSGTIHVDCGLNHPLTQPIPLTNRCTFSTTCHNDGIPIYLGMQPPDTVKNALWGDARGRTISYHTCIPRTAPAHPVACFGLAGYLGFAALATAIGIPPHREHYCTTTLHLPLTRTAALCPESITLIGLGQLGQAYLAILHFLAKQNGQSPNIILIDKDPFEPPNQRTQVLLEEHREWNGQAKATYLETITRNWGWNTTGEIIELQWGWQRPQHHPAIALLGVDDLDVRRMAIAAGYHWIIDAGLSTTFTNARISWHSVPPDNVLARALFPPSPKKVTAPSEETPFTRKLRATPGHCGWDTFNSITAAAPAMGLAAAAYAISELLNDKEPVIGRAPLWSTLLPYHRELSRTETQPPMESSGIRRAMGSRGHSRSEPSLSR